MWSRPASSTRWMSSSATALAATSTPALNTSLDTRPQDTLTITLSMVCPAWLSAASTALRMACSAASMSTMTPLFTPAERLCPKPITSTACVRPGRTSWSAAGRSLAMRQQTLLEPKSSTLTSAAGLADIEQKKRARLVHVERFEHLPGLELLQAVDAHRSYAEAGTPGHAVAEEQELVLNPLHMA